MPVPTPSESRAIRRLQQASVQCLKAVLPDLFGRLMVQVGGADVVAAGEAGSLMPVITFDRPPTPGVSAWTDCHCLPLSEGVADAVLLPFTLLDSPAPMQIIREVDRVLNDRGRMVVLSLSPWSPLNWWSLRFGLAEHPARLAALPSLRRLRDWLTLLDYEVSEVQRFSSTEGLLRPWRDGEGSLWRRALQPLQAGYVLTARKRVIPLNRLPAAARLRPVARPFGESRPAVARFPERSP